MNEQATNNATACTCAGFFIGFLSILLFDSTFQLAAYMTAIIIAPPICYPLNLWFHHSRKVLA